MRLWPSVNQLPVPSIKTNSILLKIASVILIIIDFVSCLWTIGHAISETNDDSLFRWSPMHELIYLTSHTTSSNKMRIQYVGTKKTLEGFRNIRTILPHNHGILFVAATKITKSLLITLPMFNHLPLVQKFTYGFMVWMRVGVYVCYSKEIFSTDFLYLFLFYTLSKFVNHCSSQIPFCTK